MSAPAGPARLHSRDLGEAGPRVALCHGLFGQGRNFTRLARELAPDHRVLLVDLPDHGRSSWSPTFSYAAMADALAAHLRAVGGDEPWQLLGHSMGGKTAMLATLRHPGLVERLVVEDIAPVTYERGTTFESLVAGMRALPLGRLTDRAEADAALAPAVPDPGVRGFLLQNLRRDDAGRFSWQVNLDLLADHLPELGGWPADAVPAGASWDGPVLWVAGADSAYVRPRHGDAMRSLFPRTRLVTIKDCGHWVHSEQPEVFGQVVRRFLAP